MNYSDAVRAAMSGAKIKRIAWNNTRIEYAYYNTNKRRLVMVVRNLFSIKHETHESPLYDADVFDFKACDVASDWCVVK